MWVEDSEPRILLSVDVALSHPPGTPRQLDAVLGSCILTKPLPVPKSVQAEPSVHAAADVGDTVFRVSHPCAALEPQTDRAAVRIALPVLRLKTVKLPAMEPQWNDVQLPF